MWLLGLMERLWGGQNSGPDAPQADVKFRYRIGLESGLGVLGDHRTGEVRDRSQRCLQFQ